MTRTSWWVGKDRDAFNVALKDHTTRVMRGETNAAPLPALPVPDTPTVVAAPVETVPVAQEPAPVVSTPNVRNSRRWNASAIAEGRCARCGEPRTHHANLCEACQAKYTARVQRREGFHAWRPGHQGRIPAAVKPLLAIAASLRDGLREHPNYHADPAIYRAAVVMVVGFLFHQQIEWIVGWTGFPTRECRQIAARLREHGIWREDGLIACEWMDAFANPKANKRKAWHVAEIAFQLDALVGAGICTRETRPATTGETGAVAFMYGLSEWRQT